MNRLLKVQQRGLAVPKQFPKQIERHLTDTITERDDGSADREICHREVSTSTPNLSPIVGFIIEVDLLTTWLHIN